MHLLVTGFEPFAGLKHNPSAALLPHLPKTHAGYRVETRVLAVDTETIRATLSDLYAMRPALVLHLGLARERNVLSLERVALNLLDFDVPDNKGRMALDRPVTNGGPLARASRLPLRAISDAWREKNIPCELSQSAGTFLCNQTMYLGLEMLPEEVHTGFIHLPPDETLGLSLGCPFVPLATQVEAVLIALELALTTPRA